MPDIIKTRAQLQSDYADNTTQAITEQALRNFVVSVPFWRGAWNSATAYAINDEVTSAGGTYIAIVANTNSAPPSANWTAQGTAPPVTSVAGKTGAVTLAEADVAGLVADLAAKLTAASNLSDLASAGTARTNLGLGSAAIKNADNTASNIPLLDGSGKLATSVLPAIAIGETFTAASQAAMLALTAQAGDSAIRTDDGNHRYLLLGTDPTVLGNWIKQLTTTDAPVQSVNGQTGSVVLTTTQIAEGTRLYFTNARAIAAAAGTYLPLAGGTMAGNVNMGGNQLSAASYLNLSATLSSNGDTFFAFDNIGNTYIKAFLDYNAFGNPVGAVKLAVIGSAINDLTPYISLIDGDTNAGGNVQWDVAGLQLLFDTLNQTYPITFLGSGINFGSPVNFGGNNITGGGGDFDLGNGSIQNCASITINNALTMTAGNMTLAGGGNIVLSATTGSKIGSANTEKLGFWGATPVIQPHGANQAALTDSTGGTASTTLSAITAGASYSQTDMTNVKNAIASLARLLNQLRNDAVTIGTIKGAA